MMKNLNRREFMRIAGLMGGASLFAGCDPFRANAPVPEYIEGAPATDPVETLKGVGNFYTVCGLCPGNCGIRCRVAQGVLVKIGGSPYHPVATRAPLPFDTPMEEALLHGGSVCAIGGSGVQTLYDPFRIARPLKRVGPRGSGKWKALSWKEALHEIEQGGDLFGEGRVNGLDALKESGRGPAFLAGNAEWGSMNFLKSFLAAFPAASLLGDKAAMMEETARAAAESVFGPGTGPVAADYSGASFVFSFGDAPLDSGVPLVSLARDIADARIGEPRLQWAVVDPRLSTSASKADLWIPVIPGKDMALALAIMRALIERYPDRVEIPGDGVKARVMERTTEDYASACGVDLDRIFRVARLLTESGRGAAVIPGRGILSQPDGLETAKAILTLNVMVGSGPGSEGLVGRDDEFLKEPRQRLIGEIAENFKPESYGDPVNALILWQADPVYDDPGSAADYFQDQGKVPLSVAIDTEITETTALADYLLPDTTYLERWDICQSPPSVTEPGIGVRSPVVGGVDAKTGRYFPIVRDAMPMEDIIFHIAADLDIKGFERDSSGRINTARDYYEKSLAIVLKSMGTAGFPVSRSKTAVADVFKKGGVFLSGGPLIEVKTRAPKEYVRKPFSLKIPAEGPASDGGGLLLITYSLPFHRSPGAGLNSWLLEVLPENRIMINSRDAKKLGIENLADVVVESHDGKTGLRCKAQVVPGIRPGVAALARGFGYTQSGAKAQIVDGRATDSSGPRGAGINPQTLLSGKGPSKVIIRPV